MTDPLDQLAAGLSGQPGSPPLDKWHPPLSGDMDLLITAAGEWLHEGKPIHRESLVRLFASILRREQDGEYYLVTPVEKWRIRVEDAALQVVAVEWIDAGSPEQLLRFQTNTGTTFPLCERYPLWVEAAASGEPRPYLGLANGLTGLIVRPLFYELVERATAREGELQLRSSGRIFSLGRYAD